MFLNAQADRLSEIWRETGEPIKKEFYENYLFVISKLVKLIDKGGFGGI